MSTAHHDETPAQHEDGTRPVKRPKTTKDEEATPPVVEKTKVIVLAHNSMGRMPSLHWTVISRSTFDPAYLDALQLASDEADGEDAKRALVDVEEDLYPYQARGEEMSLHELFRRMQRGDYEAEFFWYESCQRASDTTEKADLERLSDVNDLAKWLLDWACTELGIAQIEDEMFKEENEAERIHRTSVLFAAACELLWEKEQLGNGRSGVANHWHTVTKFA